MPAVLLRKLSDAALTLFCATLVLFILIRLAPGDPAVLLLGQPAEVAGSQSQAYERKAEELRAQWGLDRPVFMQYAGWLGRLLQLDLGTSLYTGRQVSEELAERLPATLQLSLAALFIQVTLGIALGAVSALKAGAASDNLIRFACVALASTPAFVTGLFLLLLFAVSLGAYEISSEATWNRLWLPALTMGLASMPQFARMVRANMLAELGQTYVLAALSRGLSRRKVVAHACRNALLPLVTVVALSFAAFLGGAVVIESLFSWPGIGKYALDSILRKDYPVIQGYAFIMVAFVIVLHLCVDVLYAYLDPRLHHKRKRAAAGVEEHA
ncbi:ABC transporter permease [Xylanibacillus composti]|uniref:Peptide ABC transporter permease n=1 Tax=Xylanibacillus composti TaxID=1572762 RepID=A0A8J4M0H4_9BACL|nr:ABC transporter permease [Xylanibacillus composti]MDT9723950.1 ABC transporter permease [Xylanibacillus composti]GIQ67830.1 peptide ABC transporter permease [Xylanibacillus composti]